MDQFEEKTHEATQHRREQAAEEGHIPRSQDLASATLLLAAFLLLWYLGGAIGSWLTDFTAVQLSEVTVRTDAPTTNSLMARVLIQLGTVLLPILGGLLLVAVVVNFLQVGWVFLPEKVLPDLGHLDPMAGLERVFSLNNSVRLGFGLLKVAMVAGIALWCLWNEHEKLLGLASMGIGQIAAYIWETAIWTGVKIAACLVLLAGLDYFYQYWKYEEDLKMTTQEIREEMKSMQGDPQILARRRQAMRQMVLQNVSQAIPKADAIITNPTELAIAIKYEPAEMAAPIVIAKGAGLIAQRIRRLALENNVPIVERKELARILYREVDLNHPVPIEQYAAVAEVLKYVYQLKGKTPKGLAARM